MIEILLAMSQGFGSTVWNVKDKSAATGVSNTGFTTALTATRAGIRATSPSNGKVCFEVEMNTDGNTWAGVASKEWLFTDLLGYGDTHSAAYWKGGSLGANSQALVAAATYTTGDVITVAVDSASHLAYFAKNGVWQNSADPAAGVGGIDYITTAAVYPAVQYSDNFTTIGAYTARFDLPFTYPIPVGFSPWG